VPARRRDRRLAWALALLAVIAVSGGTLWFVRLTTKAPEAALTAVPLTTYPGFQEEPSFSPDGNQVAFSWNDHIYVKLIGTSGPPLRLTTDPARDYSPARSPDGRFIAFLRDLPGGRAAVLLIPALGGPERKVSEVFPLPQQYLPGPYLAWSPDGSSLAISDKDSSVIQPYALFLLSIETGEKRRLTSPPVGLTGDSGPAFSPDGRALGFSRTVDGGVSDLYLLTFSEGLRPLGEPRSLTFGNRGAISPAWTADGREIIFGNWRQSGLWRVVVPLPRKRPAEPQQLATLGGDIVNPAISRRGRRLAYAHVFLRSNIWRIAAPGATAGLPRGASGAQPLISSTRDDSSPHFSPDGKKVAFVSTRSGNREIWVCDSDGSNAVQLSSFNGPDITTPRWSPDGGRIAFDSTAAGGFDVWVVGVNGGKPQRMTTHPAKDGNPSWSHDGRWIYFDSTRAGRQQQVFKIPANGGEATQVTRDGGWAPLESPDGKFLYYAKALSATSLWKIPIEGGQASKVLEGLSIYINLAIVDSGVYFVPVRNAAGSSIQFLNFATNQVRTVASFEKPLDGLSAGLAVSPDGRWILYTQVEQAGSELMLVENFH
jgi:Tol biopolymer transport system component